MASSDTNYLRLHVLPPTALPTHPSLAPTQTNSSPVSLRDFLHSVFTQALRLSDETFSSSFQPKGAPKTSTPSTAKVQILTATLDGEFWAARSSVHEAKAEEGTATYEELEGGLFDDHSVHEKDYTPDLYDARKVCDWESQIGELEDIVGMGVGRPVMELYEMCHNLPTPLTHRCFATLVVRTKTSQDAFVVVQLPVEISKTDAAFYSNGRHRSEGENSEQKAKVVTGKYVSVERVKPVQGGEGGAKSYHWDMATASDAGGLLPMSVQKMGVPGAVVKDVGYFMKWRVEERRKTTS